MNIRPFLICVMVSLLYVLMGLAMATRAGETTFMPVEIRPSSDPAQTVIVKRGDHLWKLSATHLADLLDRAVADQEISPYWRDTIDANVDSLRSGDPDLIYPGEQVVLPAIEQP